MYVEIEFNLMYQVEQLAKRTGRSVTELVNEAVAQYLERQPSGDSAADSTPADAP